MKATVVRASVFRSIAVARPAVRPTGGSLGGYVRALFLAASAISVLSCSSALKLDGAGDYSDDDFINHRVKAAIFDEPLLRVAQISVETVNGAVVLRGSVASQAVVGKAVAVAREVSGVHSVKNETQVKTLTVLADSELPSSPQPAGVSQ